MSSWLAIALALALSLALAGSAFSTLASATSSEPAALSDCTPSSGVLVAVDFSHWSLPVDLGCAAGAQSNGLDAMHHAGFVTAGDEANGDAFVCRIGVAAEGDSSERPTPAEDPCVSTPPASAYWGFFVADAGKNSWTYSTAGVASFKPPAGTIEGWAFGAGAPPSVTPAEVRAEASSSTTTTTTRPTTTTEPGTTATTVPTTSSLPDTTHTTGKTTVGTTAPASIVHHGSSTTVTHGSRTSTTTPHRTTSTSTPSSQSGSATASGRSRIVAIGAGPGDRPTGQAGGSSTGVIVGSVVVALLAAAGGTVAWRRRRAE